MKRRNIVGEKFGRLVVVRLSRKRGLGNQLYWLCRCNCGVEVYICGNNLKSGKTRSCGCLRVERSRSQRFQHGFSETREYQCWLNMLARCYNVRRDDYQWYGLRGVKVCKRWRNSFEVFYKDMGKCPPGLTLERIDNDGNYEPGNCKWATQAEQNRNKRRRRIV